MKLGVMGSAVVQFNGAVFLFKLMINVSYEFCYSFMYGGIIEFTYMHLI